MLDPMAGNSVLTFLGTSLNKSAMNQIDTVIDTSARMRSRQRRKRELGGPSEISNQNGFAAIGSYEEEQKEKFDKEEKETETNTLANSSVYGLLHEPDDVESFKNFYYMNKKEEDDDDKIELKPFEQE